MVYIYGASGHGKVVIEIAELLNVKISGVIDDNISISKFLDYKVVHSVPSNLEHIVIAIGKNNIRKLISQQLTHVKFPVLIHPNASVSRSAMMNAGTVVMAGVSINSDCNIGKHVILNTNCSIDHDCKIGDYVHVSPNAALAGNVTIEEGTHIGIGACVIQGIKIGKWCTIGAGAVILKDIPDFSTVVGNPGKIIKTTNNFINEH